MSSVLQRHYAHLLACCTRSPNAAPSMSCHITKFLPSPVTQCLATSPTHNLATFPHHPMPYHATPRHPLSFLTVHHTFISSASQFCDACSSVLMPLSLLLYVLPFYDHFYTCWIPRHSADLYIYFLTI